MDPHGPASMPPEGEDLAAETERLAARIEELRVQLGAMVPGGAARSGLADEATGGAQQDDERIRVLEQMLASSRSREEALVAQALRDQAAIAELTAQVSDMTAALARGGDAESILEDSSRRADEAERRASSFADELRSRGSELASLRGRYETLESDLRAAVTEIAASAGDRVRAEQLQRERDAARDEAETRRHQVVEQRLRASAAEARVKVFEARNAALSQRLAEVMAFLPPGDRAPLSRPDEASVEAPGEPVLDLTGIAEEPAGTQGSPETEEPAGRENWDRGWG